MRFFSTQRLLLGCFFQILYTTSLIKGEGSSKMSSQRQLLGPPCLFGMLEYCSLGENYTAERQRGSSSTSTTRPLKRWCSSGGFFFGWDRPVKNYPLFIHWKSSQSQSWYDDGVMMIGYVEKLSTYQGQQHHLHSTKMHWLGSEYVVNCSSIEKGCSCCCRLELCW